MRRDDRLVVQHRIEDHGGIAVARREHRVEPGNRDLHVECARAQPGYGFQPRLRIGAGRVIGVGGVADAVALREQVFRIGVWRVDDHAGGDQRRLGLAAVLHQQARPFDIGLDRLLKLIEAAAHPVEMQDIGEIVRDFRKIADTDVHGASDHAGRFDLGALLRVSKSGEAPDLVVLGKRLGNGCADRAGYAGYQYLLSRNHCLLLSGVVGLQALAPCAGRSVTWAPHCVMKVDPVASGLFSGTVSTKEERLVHQQDLVAVAQPCGATKDREAA